MSLLGQHMTVTCEKGKGIIHPTMTLALNVEQSDQRCEVPAPASISSMGRMGQAASHGLCCVRYCDRSLSHPVSHVLETPHTAIMLLPSYTFHYGSPDLAERPNKAHVRALPGERIEALSRRLRLTMLLE